MNYEPFLATVKSLGDELPTLAGKVVDIGVKKKWLTEKDIEVERRLTEMITALPGDHSVFAEEEHEDFTDAENVWVIDPISSTSSFINGIPTYSVVIAHLQEGKPIFAAIYDPSRGELFSAVQGQGALLNGEPIRVSDDEKTMAIFTPYIFPHYPKEEILSVMELLLNDDATIRNYGSFGLHYCYVACGRANVVIHGLKDTFPEYAGKLIIEEAGGELTDWHGNPLTPTTDRVLATNGQLHDKYIKLLETL